MAAGENLNNDHYIEAASEAWLEWDGESTAELILDIIRRTRESVPEVLEEAMTRYKKEQA